MNITGIHHVSIIVADTALSLRFYCHVLGLQQDHSRPDLGFPGAWLTTGKQQIHLLELTNPDPVTGRPEHGGRDRHIALSVTDLNACEASLLNAAIPYRRSKSGRCALFCRDPDGNAVELVEDVREV